MASVVQPVRPLPQPSKRPSSPLRASFAHPSEAEFGALLSYYGISWLYEPVTFPLAWDGEGRVTQAFSPDFYLPDYDLYIELATRKQGQMTSKNRKIRALRRLYPDVRIKLVNRGAFADLLRRFGLEERAAELIGTVATQSGHA